jgi:hypothetical protein
MKIDNYVRKLDFYVEVSVLENYGNYIFGKIAKM